MIVFQHVIYSFIFCAFVRNCRTITQLFIIVHFITVINFSTSNKKQWLNYVVLSKFASKQATKQIMASPRKFKNEFFFHFPTEVQDEHQGKVCRACSRTIDRRLEALPPAMRADYTLSLLSNAVQLVDMKHFILYHPILVMDYGEMPF